MTLDQAHRYILAQGLAVALAVVVTLLRGRTFAISRRAYWQARLTPWKLGLFAIAAGGMMLIAPHTGDPTWDWIDSGFMALFTYLTAPWTLGVLVRVRRSSSAELYVAACTWLFSAGWSYDLYIFVRDAGGLRAAWSHGFYPLSWSSNLIASSLLYAAGGACFSLSAPPPGRVVSKVVTRLRVTLPFSHDDWPAETPASVREIAPIALVFVLVVTAMLGPFVYAAMRDR